MATRNVGRRPPLSTLCLSRSFSVHLELYDTFFRVSSQLFLGTRQFEGNAFFNLSDSIFFLFHPVSTEVSCFLTDW